MNLELVISRNFTKISDAYRKFAIEKDACRSCSIYNSYQHVGQSEGNALKPTFMLIGEALGSDEIEQKRPFIGRAGQRLRAELRKHPKTFSKETTIISNVLCCRPQNNQFPGTDFKGSIKDERTKKGFRSVGGREIVRHCYTSWTEKEIHLLRPKVIVTVGAKALESVRGDTGITQHRGSWKFLPAYQAWSVAIFHPSYVLRCQNDPAKQFVVDQFEEDIERIAKTWSDMVYNDPRMKLTPEEWEREIALQHGAKIGLFKKNPVSDPFS